MVAINILNVTMSLFISLWYINKTTRQSQTTV